MRLSVAVAAVAAVLACAPVIAANNSSSSSSSEVAIHAARELQERADDVARELQTAEHRVRSSHNVLHSRAIAHRNALLRRVPHFWYDALLGLPRYDGFLSLLPEDSGDFEITSEDDTFVHPDAMESAPWGADSETGYPAVADDHFILKNFLHEARCYVVKGGADVTREQLDQLVHAPGRSGNDGGVEDDGSRYYVPDDLDLGMSTQHGLGSHDVAEESYRVVLSFKPNPYFADQRLYKQLPIAHAHMLFTSDLDVQEALGLGPKLGQGNTVSWSSRTVREGVLKPAKDNSPSFFAAFDDDVYTSADRALKELLQMRAASFVSSLCMYLEPDPLPFWERRVVERESHVQRTKMILGTTKDPDGVEPVVPDDPPLDDEGVEAVPPPHEDEFVDLLNTTTDDEVQAESTSDHVSEEAPDVHQPVEEPTTQEDAGDEEQATPLSTADVETPIRAAVAVAEVETPSETTSPSPATTAAATSVPDPQPASGQTATIEQETHV